MDTPKRTNWGLTLVVVIILALIIWGIASSKKDTENTGEGRTIKIGLVAPLTGPGAVFGNSFVNAIKLAKEDIKGTTNAYEIIVDDDGTNPAQSASAAQKLINVDKVNAIISITSGSGNAIKPIATAARVPHICICTDTSVAETEYNFTNLLLPDDEASGWLSEAQKRGVKTVAILHQNQSGINAIVSSLEKLAPEYNITVVYKEMWDPTIRDFKTILGKAKASKPDIFYLVSFPPSLDIIGKELKDAGIRNISSSAAFGITASPALFEGLWYNDGNVANIAFRTRFEQAFPGITFNVRSAPYGYDSYQMFVEGFESGDVYKYLKDITSFDGIAGKITKGAGTRSFHSQPGLWIIKNSKAEKLQ